MFVVYVFLQSWLKSVIVRNFSSLSVTPPPNLHLHWNSSQPVLTDSSFEYEVNNAWLCGHTNGKNLKSKEANQITIPMILPFDVWMFTKNQTESFQMLFQVDMSWYLGNDTMIEAQKS